MGMLKTEDLQRLWALIQSAPVSALSLLVAVVGASAMAGWLSRGQVASAKIDGLEQRLALADERLKFAEEKVQAQILARQDVDRQFNELKAQTRSDASMAARFDALEKALDLNRGASKALETAVVRGDMRVSEQPDSASVEAVVH
ncbi:hypothetical protein [Methylobacterium brachiatum]|uniref:DNA recombination protein RmuC n=1 Tax=Methylobacterium brachiatum TaxID=269660 RepID=A0ABV1RB15_9HYPH